jgi:hypothetical protein
MSSNVTVRVTDVVVRSASSDVVVRSAGPVIVAAGGSGPTGPAGATWQGYYGSFSDSTTQTITANTATPIRFNTTEESNGVTVGSPTSRLVIANAGTYNVQFSAQVDKTDGGQDDATIWLRVNGTDVARTATDLTLEQSARRIVAAWNFVYTFTAGQYVELVWSSPDSSMRLLAAGTRTGPVRPAVPSVICTVTRVA